MSNKPHDIEQWLTALGNPSADRDYKPGHERLQQLLAHLQLERPKLRIRVAGTNGKGSTSFMLASALQACGFKVGLYTSPHILEFNERIRINGAPVSNHDLFQSMEILMPIALDVEASYFETATALALDQFSKSQVDVEILEAGVGARLDACTAVDADMALITPIALDHQNWLGDTLAEIALEKAHAMTGCRYFISAPQGDEVAQALQSFNAKLSFCDTAHGWDKLAAPGQHQQINASLAWAAMQQLQREYACIDLHAARSAIAQCKISGRLQMIQMGETKVWLDAAHNHHAIEALLPSLAAIADPFDAILVFTREDRSLKAVMPLLQAYTNQVISSNSYAAVNDPYRALCQAIDQKPQGSFLVLGSFITVAAILRQTKPTKY